MLWAELDGNCAIAVIHDLSIGLGAPPDRERRFRARLDECIRQAARQGYTFAIATTNEYQKNLHSNLKDFKFKQMRRFRSRRTGNMIYVWGAMIQ